ncbi:ribosome small subunit-dependent GTPase A [Chromobacterium violaceum]|uniref:Small ribosomal subunit biogenesis GTPase RsgA n=1 Tax=Chromobacterium violaceum TaxID=536 RepID=A0AAX2M992_CHRVL|nr:ribosome small subunit-dependent GTPase A [Chromobacterium violaceum]OLZ78759.1 ribosome small subunit-dependent GTPase A [Chromobacterium violaceum]OQS10152.1 ribosome small subunit-dependent GTPase A [Chromobacterium violaceum]OQS26566.1 ribosome small subunit-dependent GTPase A [Chromobacterium violaceum]STB63722.1 Putative ribosome biogenesis GTPase RsgA [Chromobacterium violaceum]SUX32491.1 Putative ribosome biogenesis GTPase RsgA [Chromobacterium violaceum]
MTASTGQIIRSHGRRFIVEADGQTFDCTTRGKRVDYACGDIVDILIQNREQAVIERAHERRSLLYRQDEWKTKVIAANVTRILFVIAAVPTPNEELLGRCLIAAEAGDIDPVIVVNKSDLPETAALLEKLQLYVNLGYKLVTLSAKQDFSPLKPLLSGHTSVLVGQSGMGKSTLTNALLPDANARIGDISEALDSGRHTTTHATLYHLDENSHLIDSPGLQEFGLKHLKSTDLIHYFPEMRRYIGQCRFHNCSHCVEPNCAIIAAAEQGAISKHRLDLLQRLSRELG